MPLTEEQEKDINSVCDHMRAWRDEMLLGREHGKPSALGKLLVCQDKFVKKYSRGKS
jgi:hypothetical protein